MQSFGQYLENRQINELIREAATLFTDLDIDVEEFLFQMEFTESDLYEQGFFNSVKNWVQQRPSFQAAKGFFGNLGKGIQSGFAMGKDALIGPAAKYTKAIQTLTDLTKTLSNNPATAQMKSGNNKTPVTQFLQRVIDDLQRQQKMIPKMTMPQNLDPSMQQPGRAPAPTP